MKISKDKGVIRMVNNMSRPTGLTTDFAFHIPPPADGASIETMAVTQRLIDKYRTSIGDWKKKIGKVEDIMTKWKTSILAQIGEAKWKEFSEYSRKQFLSRYGLKEMIHDPEGLAKLATAKREAREKSLILLKDTKLKSDDLKSIHRKFTKDMADLLRPKEPNMQRLEIVPESKLPKEILEGKINPWTIRKPPYDGWAWSYFWKRSGGYDPDLVNYLNVMSGSVGHRSEYQNYSAGDWDYLWLEFDNSIGVWYWPPRAGQVDMWIKARCANARYCVWLDDEYGWSGSGTGLGSHITVNLSPSIVDEDRIPAWWFSAGGSPDNRTYLGDFAPPNTVLWFHIITSVPIPSGAWTYIKVGTYDRHQVFLNDVSTYQVMRNWWYFEELWFDVI